MPDVYLVVSNAGYQKSKVSSRRIYNYCRAAKEAGHVVYLFTMSRRLEDHDRYDYGFLDGIRFVRTRAHPILSFVYWMITRHSWGIGEIKSEMAEESDINSRESGFKSLIRRCLFGRNMSFDNRSMRFLSASSAHYRRMITRQIRDLKQSLERDSKIVLFTSAQPGLVHMVGAAIRKRNPHVFWIADYRDPKRNVGNPGFDESYSARVDRTVARYADLVTSASILSLECIFQGIECWPPFLIVHNGFGLQNIRWTGDLYRSDRQRVSYLGTVYRSQDISELLQAISFDKEKREFHYAGRSWQSVQGIVSRMGATNVFNHGYVSLEEAHRLTASSDILVVLKKKWGYDAGRLFAKFYEYLLYDIPILVVGDRDPEFNALAGEVGGVTIVPYDIKAIVNALDSLGRTRLPRNPDSMRRLEWTEMFRRIEYAVSGGRMG